MSPHQHGSCGRTRLRRFATRRSERSIGLPILARENAIAQEPGLSYPEALAVCVSTRRFDGGADFFESSPYETLSRGAFSAPSLVTPTR